MNSELEILERIELYSRGKLNEEEKTAFEKQLASDPQLKKRLEASLIVDEILIGHEALKLKEQMRKDLSPSKPKWPVYFSGALLLVVAGGIYYMTRTPEQVEKPPPHPLPVAVTTPTPQDKKIDTTVNSVPKTVNVIPPKETAALSSNKKLEVVISQPEASLTPRIEEKLPVEAVVVTHLPIQQKKESTNTATAKIVEPSSPCKNLLGEVDFYTVPSCVGTETGELHIDVKSLKGGTSPFVFAIGEKTSSSVFYHLSPGSYQLVIKDAKGCTVVSTKEVVVKSKACKQKEYSFNPDFDPSWTIPYDLNKEPKSFRIMDKGGKLFFQTSVSGFYPAEWKGESSTGLSLGLGLYFFTIEYLDGTLEEGSVAITR